MKKILVILLIFVLVFSICGCDNNEVYKTINGKTFYSVIDRNGNEEHSFVTFNSDKTFEMSERYLGGFVKFYGEYTVSNKSITCSVFDSAIGEFSNITYISFSLKDPDTLILQNGLLDSIFGDEFSTNNYVGENKEIKTPYGKFINTNHIRDGKRSFSTLLLKEDGTFVLEEHEGLGVTLVEGMYGREGDILMFSNFEPFMSMNNEKLYNFEFRIINDYTIELIRDLESSKYGSYFTLVEGIENLYAYFNSTYIHSEMEDVLNEYLPKVEFKDDGTFVFYENVYEGMGEYKGTYEKVEDYYVLTIKDREKMQGFDGYDVYAIVLQRNKNGFRNLTKLCMTNINDQFVLD